MNHSTNRIRGMTLIRGMALGLCIGLQLAACHPKPPQAAQPADPAAANDTKLFERMEKMRARAKNAPGGATEASDFASHVTMLFTQGVAKRRPVAPALVDEAVQCLDQAKEAKPDDGPDLLVRKGELLLAAGKSEPGAGALRESIALRPSLRAFNPLAKYYAAENQSTELVALCKKTLPAMKSEESRYAVLDDCLKYSGATAPEAGLGWAPPKELAFYKARRRGLEARKEAAKEAKGEQPKAQKR
ncbi:MAG TPA: hypothetical protein VF524_13535 [Polyangia bacterium]